VLSPKQLESGPIPPLAPDTDYEKAAQESAELTAEDLINNEMAKLGKNEGVKNFDAFGQLSTGAQGWKCPVTAMPASAPREFSSIKSMNYPARRGAAARCQIFRHRADLKQLESDPNSL